MKWNNTIYISPSCSGGGGVGGRVFYVRNGQGVCDTLTTENISFIILQHDQIKIQHDIFHTPCISIPVNILKPI